MHTISDHFIGKPYRVGGEGPDDYDCYGLTRAIAAERGFELPRQSTAESVEMREAIFATEPSSYLDIVCFPEPFDLTVFDFGRPGLHIATMTAEPGRFIHVAEFTKTVRIDRLGVTPYRENIYGFYRPIYKNRIAATTA